MTKIKTNSGFEIEIDENRIDDMEFFEDITEIDQGNFMKLPSVIKRLFGEEGKARLYDHIRTEDGRVPVLALSDELTDVFQQLKSKKK